MILSTKITLTEMRNLIADQDRTISKLRSDTDSRLASQRVRLLAAERESQRLAGQIQALYAKFNPRAQSAVRVKMPEPEFDQPEATNATR